MKKVEIQPAITAGVAGIAGAAIGGIIGAIAGWRAASATNRIQKQIADDNVAFQKKLAADAARAQQRAFVDSMVLKMLEFLIAHPHLEKDDFCQKYPDVPGHENGRERYEAYCCFVFNMLMTAFKHFDQDSNKLREFIHLDEIIRCHYRWWQHDKDNLEYDEPFRRCIQDAIDKLRKEGKIQ